jgi:hypothetical protein
MVMCDPDYKFIVVDVRSKERNSDGGVFGHSLFGRDLQKGDFPFTPDSNLPRTNIKFPDVIVAD